MFWKSIIDGLAILAHWQVLLAIILYTAVNFAFFMINAKVAGEDEESPRMAMGCLFNVIGGTIIHGILMGLMVAFLLPILLGETSTASISAIKNSISPIIIAGIIAVVVVTILCIIPFIGGFIARSPGIEAFLEGIIIFRIYSDSTVNLILTGADIRGNVYPGFWESIGFLFIAFVLVRAIMLLFVLLTSPFEDTVVEDLMPIVVGPVFGVLGGIIPLFMYCSYVRLSIMQLIGG